MCQCLKASARFFLYLLNSLLIIISLNILAITIYIVTLLLLNDIPDLRTICFLAVILSLGIFLFILPIVGCVGIYKQKRCLIFAYAVLLILIAVIFLSIALATFILGTEKQDDANLKRRLETAFSKYEKSEMIRNEIDIVQQNLRCCGVDGVQSWHKGMIPESCCEKSPCKEKNSFRDSCYDAIVDNRRIFLNNLAGLSGVSAFTIIGVAVLSLWSMKYKKGNVDLD